MLSFHFRIKRENKVKSCKYLNTRSYLWCLKNSLADINLWVKVEKHNLGTQTWVSILAPSNNSFTKLRKFLNLSEFACFSTRWG